MLFLESMNALREFQRKTDEQMKRTALNARPGRRPACRPWARPGRSGWRSILQKRQRRFPIEKKKGAWDPDPGLLKAEHW